MGPSSCPSEPWNYPYGTSNLFLTVFFHSICSLRIFNNGGHSHGGSKQKVVVENCHCCGGVVRIVGCGAVGIVESRQLQAVGSCGMDGGRGISQTFNVVACTF